MANYTMEIRQMTDNPLIGLFTFDYDFYSDNLKDKEAFEKLFIDWYYFREIGFETPEHFKVRLQSKLNLIMPYYRQLAMTEWNKVRTIEQMMTSKNLIETTSHEQLLTGTNSTDLIGNTQNNQESTTSSSNQGTTESEQTVNSTSSGTSTQLSKVSNLADGVCQASLENGYLTSVSQTDSTSSETNQQSGNQTSSSNDTTNISGTQSDSYNMNQSSSGKNEQKITDKTTFTSKGDIGIQTPAYAITEWRKVLININQMIIDDCNDLFMKLY